MLGSSHFFGSGLNGANDLVIACAAAKIASKAKTDFLCGRIRVLVEQRLGCNQKARSADAALKGGMGNEIFLQGMELVALGHAFDCSNLGALDFSAEHEAGADEAAVDSDAAGAAVTGAAAFLGAGHAQTVAQHVEQRLIGIAHKLNGIPVNGG